MPRSGRAPTGRRQRRSLEWNPALLVYRTVRRSETHSIISCPAGPAGASLVDPVEPRERVRQIGIADPRCRYRTDFRIFSAFGLRSLSAISCSDIRSCQSEFPTPATDRKETERPREGWFNLYILFSRSVKQRHAVSIAAELEDGGANADVTLLKGTASKQVDERL